jgi:hypothetical protein
VRRLIALLMLCALPVWGQDALPMWAVMEAGGVTYDYWSAYDSSGNDYHGTCSTNTILTQDGEYWYGDFDGSSDEIDVTNLGVPGLSAISYRSWSVWIYIDTTTKNQTVFARQDGDGDGWGVYLRYRIPVLFWQTGGGSTYRYVTGSSTLATGQWHHLSVTYDGTISTGDGVDRVVMKANGTLESMSLLTGVGALTPLYDYSGTTTTINDGTFDGRMDTASIYSATLSTNDTATIYSAGRQADKDAISDDDLTGFWSMIPEEE